jgi:hypothetical protein
MCLHVGRVVVDGGQGTGDRGDRLQGHGIGDRVGVRRVEGFHGVGQRVDAADHGNRDGETEGELHVVHDRFRQDRG